MTISPSRVLNERIGILGLSVLDFAVLGYGLIALHGVLTPIGIELLAFPILGVVAVSLVGIRMSYRPKIIRDYVTYHLIKRVSVQQRMNL